MERKIGERFDYKGEILEVVEQDGCEGCYFDGSDDCSGYVHVLGSCVVYKPERRELIFKKVGKTIDLLTKAHEYLVRCGIESEIVQEIEEYLNKTK